jgi:GT2 family glycosyltransferase
MKKLDIIILNYNGKDILPVCLPSVVAAAKNSPVQTQVIILDNKSTDNSLDYVKKTFPEVKIEISKENRVLFSYNDFVKKLDSDIVILLNSDVKVEPDFIPPLLTHFSDPDVFAAAPKQYSLSGKTHEGGKNKLEFTFGQLKAGPLYHESPVMEIPGSTFYEANSAYDRHKFIELGGFDDIYAPFLWEDTDIGYRAWKSGYKFVYEPKSVIYHHESFTFDQEKGKIRKRRIMTRRNSFIFTWKNFTDATILMNHFLMLPLNLFAGLFFDWARIAAFAEAVCYIPRIIKRRSAQKAYIKISDKEVFARAEESL